MRGIIAPREKGIDYWIIHTSYDYMRCLFTPRSEDRVYALNAVIHFFMKRLGQSYETIMLMPSSDRDEIFDLEMKVVEAENKSNEESANKSRNKRR